MTPGLRRRWYCSNVVGCARARSDEPFWERDLKQGVICSQCGQSLVEGKPIDVRARRIAVGAAVAVTAVLVVWALKAIFFPTPLQYVDFAQHETRVQQNGITLTLPVVRSRDVNRRETVRFSTVDGTAKAGVNYEAAQGELVFEPGETSRDVRITVLPGSGRLKSDLYFNLILVNVANKPHQVVIIEEPKIIDTLAAQAERVVRAASVVAKDIADAVVREHVVTRLLSASRADPAAFERYQNALQVIQGNLRRSRESYEQSFRDMRGIQPRAVMEAMDRVSDNQNRNGFVQQARATAIMKRQFDEYLSDGNMDMDRWANELSSVVPVARSGGASAL
ncbi:Calx-beta domain-containing protein [Caballeronia sp. M1242]|uniref:Calx-beta domain-containing protein n=1 Tax=Caballeronia sp. M1242 TaxID=2814653 RepID=UPI0019D0EAF4|nr:Calx-beta domain-containing protein [Caballeronia sp. M1242]QSN63510.1 hypothetical protein JYK05_14915 [Caballeronia sp. M1242]